MITRIHFKENGKHRILSIVGFYEHRYVVHILKENKVKIDDARFMLTYIKTKPKGNPDD